MKKKAAKELRKLAEMLTLNKPKSETRKQYQRLKNVHKLNIKEA